MLRALERSGPSGLAELQAATGLPRATAHRLAAALERHGLVRRDGDGRYCLGLSLVGLGHAAADGFPLAELARPALVALRDESARACSCSSARATAGAASCRCSPRHGLRWIVPEGALLPLHVGSAGRVLSGELGPAGWVESVEEREAGVASVSAPVVGAGGGCWPRSASAARSSASAANPAPATARPSWRPPPWPPPPSPSSDTSSSA